MCYCAFEGGSARCSKHRTPPKPNADCAAQDLAGIVDDVPSIGRYATRPTRAAYLFEVPYGGMEEQLTTAIMEAMTEETQDASPPKRRTMVLTLTVAPENWEIVFAAVSALRSGLMNGYLVSDTEYEGPFEVDELDETILQAMADAIEGHDEGAESDYEPDIVRGRVIYRDARETAEIVRTMPVARRP